MAQEQRYHLDLLGGQFLHGMGERIPEREIKEGIVSEAKAQAQAEGDKMIKQAQATIEAEKKAAVADIKAQVASLSVEIAEKVIREELSDKKKQLKMVDEMLGDIKLN